MLQNHWVLSFWWGLWSPVLDLIWRQEVFCQGYPLTILQFNAKSPLWMRNLRVGFEMRTGSSIQFKTLDYEYSLTFMQSWHNQPDAGRLCRISRKYPNRDHSFDKRWWLILLVRIGMTLSYLSIIVVIIIFIPTFHHFHWLPSWFLSYRMRGPRIPYARTQALSSASQQSPTNGMVQTVSGSGVNLW